jgi:hypothetical protein
MSIKTTRDVTREWAIAKVSEYLAKKMCNVKELSDSDLECLLDEIANREECGLSIFDNFMITEEDK